MQTNSSTSEDQEDEELRCSECYYYFSSITKPYLLPCNHNLCINCIDNLIRINKTYCPICTTYFPKEDRNKFQVNYAFLNLVIKILQTKIIFCKKCNLIYTWAEHHKTCNQKDFQETNLIINEIKKLCEECFQIIKYIDHHKNVISSGKAAVYKSIYDAINTIQTSLKKHSNSSITELFNEIQNLNIEISKKEIIKFLEICKFYSHYFDNINSSYLEKLLLKFQDDNEIKKTNDDFNFRQRGNLFNDSLNILNVNERKKPSKSPFKKSIKKKRGNINEWDEIALDKSSDSYSEEIPNETNGKEIHQTINQFQNFLIRENSQKFNFENNIFLLPSAINIDDLLEEDDFPVNESKPIKNKLIISNRGVKVVSDFDSEINQTTKSNFDSQEGKNLISKDFINSKKKFPLNYENSNQDIFFQGNLKNTHINNDNKRKLSHKEIKNDYPLSKINTNLNKEIDLKENFVSTKILPSSINKVDPEEKIQIINKLVKNFNKVKDITNKLKRYTNEIDLYYQESSNQIDKNYNDLEKVIHSDYQKLLEDISFNYIQNQKRFLITYINNTKIIKLFDVKQKTFKSKNFETLLTNYSLFNSSVNIEYDDCDLIFLSGGLEPNSQLSTDIFIVFRWTTSVIEIEKQMLKKKAYHSGIFFNNKLYLIGGISDGLYLGDCEAYSINEQKWEIMPYLNYPRAKAAICLYNNTFLYVFRGSDKDKMLESIEFINLKNYSLGWTVYQPEDPGLSWFGCDYSSAVAIDKDKILIFGGSDQMGKLFNHSFLLDPINKIIYRTKDLTSQASFRAVSTFIQNEIIAIDFKINNKNENVHLYDYKKSIWSLL